MYTKLWYQSKTIWGAIASAIGMVLVTIGNFYGQDYNQFLIIAGTVFQAFGVPFTIYGRSVTESKLTSKK